MAPVYEEELLFGIVSGLLSGIPSVLFGIATYILTSLALYTVAKRRGLNHPWLAWIPVLNCWIVGSISDQYRYVVRGENKSKRKVLLTLSILSAVFTVAIVILAIVMVSSAIIGSYHNAADAEMMSSIMGPALAILGLCLPLVGVALAYTIIRYIALYDIYKSLDPANCVLFLVLSILFSVTEPFFLFFNRNKDGGMPPRRQEAAYIPAEDWVEENKDYL